MKPPPVRMDVSREEFEGVLARVRERLEEPDYEKLKAAIETLAYLTDLVQDREISLQRLRKILFGDSTEKTRDVTPTPPNPNPVAEQKPATEATAEKPRPGHGRHAAEAFRGAQQVEVAHSMLKPGERAPGAGEGGGTSTARGHGLPLTESALQPVRRGLHGGGAARSGQREI